MISYRAQVSPLGEDQFPFQFPSNKAALWCFFVIAFVKKNTLLKMLPKSLV